MITIKVALRKEAMHVAAMALAFIVEALRRKIEKPPPIHSASLKSFTEYLLVQAHDPSVALSVTCLKNTKPPAQR